MKKQLHCLLSFFLLSAVAQAQHPGDLVITEFMAHSKGVPDAQGEYLELYNNAAFPVNLNGCIIQDASSRYVMLDEDVWIEPGDFAVLGRSAVPSAAYSFPSDPPPFNLDNIGGDQITVTCQGRLIASVHYSSSQTSGVAMELSAVHLHENGRTQEAHYVPATHSFRYLGASVDDWGSPGYAGNTVMATSGFSHFDARLEGRQAVLEWTAISEQGGSRFIVEHSLDGERYTAIGELASMGWAAEPQQYAFAHPAPCPGLNYYRLQRLGQGGAPSFSEAKALEVPALEQPFRLYPTTAQKLLTLELSAPARADLTLGVFDLQGRRLVGAALPAGSFVAQVDVSRLPTGAYVLHWHGGGKAGSERFFKR